MSGGWRPGALTAMALLVVCLQGGEAVAQDDAEALRRGPGASAAKAFEAGNYEDAARRYEVLIETRGETPELLYNLGTSWSKAKSPGRAIWALERARLLAPGDEGVRHNLEVTRNRVKLMRMKETAGKKVTEGEPAGTFMFKLLTGMSPNGVGFLVVMLSLLTFGGLWAWRRVEAGGVRDGLMVGVVVSCLGLVAGLSIAIGQGVIVENTTLGVVLEGGVKLHQSPTTTAKGRVHADVYDGALVRVLERRADGWSHVKTVDQTLGWVRSAKVGAIE